LRQVKVQLCQSRRRRGGSGRAHSALSTQVGYRLREFHSAVSAASLRALLGRSKFRGSQKARPIHRKGESGCKDGFIRFRSPNHRCKRHAVDAAAGRICCDLQLSQLGRRGCAGFISSARAGARWLCRLRILNCGAARRFGPQNNGSHFPSRRGAVKKRVDHAILDENGGHNKPSWPPGFNARSAAIHPYEKLRHIRYSTADAQRR